MVSASQKFDLSLVEFSKDEPYWESHGTERLRNAAELLSAAYGEQPTFQQVLDFILEGEESKSCSFKLFEQIASKLENPTRVEAIKTGCKLEGLYSRHPSGYMAAMYTLVMQVAQRKSHKPARSVASVFMAANAEKIVENTERLLAAVLGEKPNTDRVRDFILTNDEMRARGHKIFGDVASLLACSDRVRTIEDGIALDKKLWSETHDGMRAGTLAALSSILDEREHHARRRAS